MASVIWGTAITCWFNSSARGRFQQNFRWVIFKLISVTDGWGISCKIALRWTPLDLTDDKSTLVQVMAWCRQATSHYLSQCWPKSMSPNGITRPQWVNTLKPRQSGCHFTDDILKCIFLNEVVLISIKISLKFIPKGPISNIQCWFRYWLGANHYLNQWWLYHCHIYVSLGFNELIQHHLCKYARYVITYCSLKKRHIIFITV